MTEKCDRHGAAPALRWQVHLKVGAVVSVLYVWAYYMTVSVVTPVQAALIPSAVMSLLFLPHGVRVLSAWIYGWRSVPYLLPGAVFCNLHFAGDRAFEPEMVAGVILSLLAAPVAFAAVRRLFGAQAVAVGQVRVAAVVGIGFLASVLNLTGLKLAYGLAPVEGAVIFVGDALGLLVSLVILWGVLRLVRREA